MLDQPDAGRRVTVSGALRLARALPVLDAIGTPYADDLRTVIATCDRPGGTPGDVVAALRRHRAGTAGRDDVARPGYYQATAAGIALLVAAPGTGLASGPEPLAVPERFARINVMIGNFWNSCDDLVHDAGGFRSPPLRQLRTTLRGVEDQWFERDTALLTGPSDPHDVLERRLADLSAKAPARAAVAETIARCAGWIA